MAAFDDLAFARRSVPRDARCDACDVAITVDAQDTLCPTCGYELAFLSTEVRAQRGEGAALAASLVGLAQSLQEGVSLRGNRGNGFGYGTEAELRAAILASQPKPPPPTSNEAIALLRRCRLTGSALQNVSLAVTGIQGDTVAIPATFGASLSSVLTAPVAFADPPTMQGLKNGAELRGRIVFARRGVCTFVHKAAVAQRAGALAVVVEQTEDVFPFTPQDSRGEASKLAEELRVPLLAIDRAAGARLRAHVARVAQTSSTAAELRVLATLRPCEDSGGICPVCQERFEAGSEVAQLPCQHYFHDECIVPWLKAHNTCPSCRYTLPSKVEVERRSLEDHVNASWFG